MKKSISYWSFEGGLDGRKDVVAAMREAKAAGFDGIELTYHPDGGPLHLGTTEADCAAILKEARSIGIGISSLASGLFWQFPPSSDDAAIRKKAVQHTKKALQVANWLKLDALLVIPGAVDVFFDPKVPVVDYDVVMKRATSFTRQLLPAARKLKVCLCIEEVWNKFLYSPLEYRTFIDQFRSPWVKSYFDTGNCVLYGYPEQWIRILGRRIKRVHFKDFKAEVGNVSGFCDLGEGSVNWKGVVAALKKAGYRSYCTAEMMPYRPGLIEKTSRDMDKILGVA